MALEDKYKALTDAGTTAGITDLAVREQDGILYIDGTAADGATKDHYGNCTTKSILILPPVI